jgi:Mg/Co/Ni transporter MgtE
MEAADMSAAVLAAGKQGTAARDAAAIGHALVNGAAWLGRAYVNVITMFAHHQAPPPGQTAAFAVTFVLVMAIVFRRRKQPASR